MSGALCLCEKAEGERERRESVANTHTQRGGQYTTPPRGAYWNASRKQNDLNLYFMSRLPGKESEEEVSEEEESEEGSEEEGSEEDYEG